MQEARDAIMTATQRAFAAYMGAIPLKNVTPMIVKNCVNHLSESSHSLYRTVLQTMRAIFDCAIDDKIISVSPIPIKMKAKGTPSNE
jgi:hypothetical protein